MNRKISFHRVFSLISVAAITALATSSMAIAQELPREGTARVLGHTQAAVAAGAAVSTGVFRQQLNREIEAATFKFKSPHFISGRVNPSQPSPGEFEHWVRKTSLQIKPHDEIFVRYTLAEPENRVAWLARESKAIKNQEDLIHVYNLERSTRVKSAIAQIEVKRARWFFEEVRSGRRVAPPVILEMNLGAGDAIAAKTVSFIQATVKEGGKISEISDLTAVASKKILLMNAGSIAGVALTVGTLSSAAWDYFTDPGNSPKVSTLQAKALNSESVSVTKSPAITARNVD